MSAYDFPPFNPEPLDLPESFETPPAQVFICGYCEKQSRFVDVAEAVDFGWRRTRSHGLVCEDCDDELAGQEVAPD